VTPEEGEGYLATFNGYLSEVIGLRYAVGLPEVQTTAEMAQSITRVRASLDRVEQAVVWGIGALTHIQVAYEAAKVAAEEAWDEAVRRERAKPVRREYEGPRERYAEANLSALALRRDERQWGERLA
jgi:hypothetical protein